MRTVTNNKPNKNIQELADYSNACVEAIVDTIKPGIEASDVAAAGRKALQPLRDKIAFHDLYAYSRRYRIFAELDRESRVLPVS